MSRTARAAGLILVAALAMPAAPRAESLAVAVADFDSNDTSGEAAERVAAHRARVAGFGALLSDSLAAEGAVKVLPFACPAAACTAASLPAEELAAAARQGGARLLVVGGIHKMSTLIQFGVVQLVDLERNQVLISRTFSFRGDTDAAFRRAAAFVGETLKEAMPPP